MRKLFYILLTFSILYTISARVFADGIRHMHYNLMYYTENGPDDCNASTNNLNTKDQAFKRIVKEIMPDVLTVNELGKGNVYSQRILDNVLNTDGIDYFAFVSSPANPSTSISICNGLFYDTRKLMLHSTFHVTTSGTYFNAYRMYYRSQELAQGDTAFITFIVCHLKAGNGYEDTRYAQAQQLMNRLVSIGRADNYVLCGDFNIYNASEPAYQHFVHHANPLVRFYDPIDREGEWDNNPEFADIFTQSTHAGGSNYCFSGGGMDNRFDFILVSEFILNGYSKIHCIPSTYQAFGQDGIRRNGSIIDPTNTCVSSVIANALYNMSDHLPVVLEYQLDATLAVEDAVLALPVSVVNPVGEQLLLTTHFAHDERLSLELFGIDGRLLQRDERSVGAGITHLSQNFPHPAGAYLLRLTDAQGRATVQKIVKW